MNTEALDTVDEILRVLVSENGAELLNDRLSHQSLQEAKAKLQQHIDKECERARVDELEQFDKWLQERSHLDFRKVEGKRVRNHIWLRIENFKRIAQIKQAFTRTYISYDELDKLLQTDPPYKARKLKLLDKIVTLAKPEIKTVRGKQYVTADFLAVVDFVEALLVEARYDELDRLPDNVADLRIHLPKRKLELQALLTKPEEKSE